MAVKWILTGSNKDIILSTGERINDKLKDKDIIVSGVGKPGLIAESMVKDGAVIVDAGSASEKGVIKGDVDESVYSREDVIITPAKGGVGPLTIASLFDHVIQAANSAR